MVNLIVVDIAAGHILVQVDESFGILLERVFLNHYHCCPYTWRDDDKQKEGDPPGSSLLFYRVCKFMNREIEIFDRQKCSNCDEYAVYEKEVQGSNEIGGLQGCKSVSYSTEGRHQCCGNSHT